MSKNKNTKEILNALDEPARNNYIQSKFSHLKADGGIINFGNIYGLDEDELREMLVELSQQIVVSLESRGETITKRIIDNSCQVAESKAMYIISKISDVNVSIDDLKQEVKTNFESLRSNIEAAATDATEDVVKTLSDKITDDGEKTRQLIKELFGGNLKGQPKQESQTDAIPETKKAETKGTKPIPTATKVASTAPKNNDDFEIENGVLKKYKGKGAKCIIPTGVKRINESVFKDCTELASVNLPDGLIEIGEAAFDGCSRLMNITIPCSVEGIGEAAFLDCDSLKEVHITDLAKWCEIDFCGGEANPLAYAHNLYLNGKQVIDLVIPSGVESIGDCAFYGCNSFNSITIPDSVTSIDSDAFRGCTGLTSIIVAQNNPKYHSANNCLIETESKTLILGCKTSVIPTDGSVTSIGSSAFKDCRGLTSITIPDSVTSIGNNALYNTAWYNNQFDGLVYAGKVAYAYKGTKPDNTSITIEEGTKVINAYAFKDCTWLRSITIPNSVTSIGSDAFSNCSELKQIIYRGTRGQWETIQKGSYWYTKEHTLYYDGGYLFEMDLTEERNKARYADEERNKARYYDDAAQMALLLEQFNKIINGDD